MIIFLISLSTFEISESNNNLINKIVIIYQNLTQSHLYDRYLDQLILYHFYKIIIFSKVKSP